MTAHQNPFRATRLEALTYRFAGDDWPTLLRRLQRQGGRGAVVGPHGSGKTTLMLELAPRLEELGHVVRYHRLGLQDRALPADLLHDLGPRSALLLDSAGCLWPWQWAILRWRARRAGVLVVTAHLPGLLPTLCRCRTNPQLLDELAGELGAPPRELGVDPDHLWQRHHGNVRDALRELYDRWPAATGKGVGPC